jgi:hypothetical protein
MTYDIICGKNPDVKIPESDSEFSRHAMISDQYEKGGCDVWHAEANNSLASCRFRVFVS